MSVQFLTDIKGEIFKITRKSVGLLLLTSEGKLLEQVVINHYRIFLVISGIAFIYTYHTITCIMRYLSV